MDTRTTFLRIALACVATGIVAGACREDLLAPANGTCPDFCPPEQLQVVDSVLFDNVTSDSAFDGYIQPYGAVSLQVARDSGAAGETISRGALRFVAFSDSLRIATTDTTRGPVLGTDSLKLVMSLQSRGAADTAVLLHVYRLPASVDSTTAYADLDPYFADSTLLGSIPITDSLFDGDSLVLLLDPLAFPDLPTAGNVAAVGLALQTAAGFVQIGASEANAAAELRRYVQVDSAGVAVPRVDAKQTAFDTYLTTPVAPPGPDERQAGGVPAARTHLRFAMPALILDSSTVLRATLELVPTAPVQGIPGDSLGVIAIGLASDLGAKSPLRPITEEQVRNLTRILEVGFADTVRLDVTALVVAWTADSTLPHTIVVRAFPEGTGLAALRFGAVSSGAARPRLHVTFVPPLQLGGR